MEDITDFIVGEYVEINVLDKWRIAVVASVGYDGYDNKYELIIPECTTLSLPPLVKGVNGGDMAKCSGTFQKTSFTESQSIAIENLSEENKVSKTEIETLKKTITTLQTYLADLQNK
jgi:hypothetical protein